MQLTHSPHRRSVLCVLDRDYLVNLNVALLWRNQSLKNIYNSRVSIKKKSFSLSLDSWFHGARHFQLAQQQHSGGSSRLRWWKTRLWIVYVNNEELAWLKTLRISLLWIYNWCAFVRITSILCASLCGFLANFTKLQLRFTVHQSRHKNHRQTSQRWRKILNSCSGCRDPNWAQELLTFLSLFPVQSIN